MDETLLETQEPEKETVDADKADEQETRASQAVKPDFLPDDLWDADQGDVKKEELLKAYEQEAKRAKGLRDKLAKGENKAPVSADGYQVTFEEGTQIDPEDKALAIAKEAALKAGLSNEQLNTFVNLYVKETGGVFLPPTEPTEEELKAYREAEYAKIGENAPAIVRGVASWKKGLLDSGVISEEEEHVIDAFGSTAEGVRVLNKFRVLMGESDIPAKTQFDDGLPSDKEIFEAIGKPEYATDAAYRAKVDNWLKERVRMGRPERLQV